MLPDLTPDEIRAACRTFKDGTSATFDGFHVKHFGLLSEQALEALCLLLKACECIGAMPTVVQAVAITLIPKAKGGYRPIGIFPAIERLWAKARLQVVQQWQEANRRPYWAYAKWAGAIDAVCKQAALAKSRTGEGIHTAAMLWD